MRTQRADIFELVLEMLSIQEVDTVSTYETKDTKNAKGGSKMVELYVTLITKGKKTIEDVPVKIRPQVEAMLKDLGIEY